MNSIRVLAATFSLLVILAGAETASAQQRAHPLYEPPDGDLPEGQPETAAETARCEAWEWAIPGLKGAFGSLDERYVRNTLPAVAAGYAPGGGGRDLSALSWRGTAWRGERTSAQLVLWTADPAEQVRLAAEPFRLIGAAAGAAGSASAAVAAGDRDAFRPEPAFVRYVRGGDEIVPDVIDDAKVLDLAARSTRPVWITIDVPDDVRPGLYRSRMTVTGAGGVRLTFILELEVLPLVLPPPREWRFHLDLWQNPYSVARIHDVMLWSDAHFSVLEPVLRMLAGAGQKCLTTTIVHQPWGGQTFDAFESMVQWTKKTDGTFAYDYTVFDRYVEFGARCGLDRRINCYSMVPWTSTVHYVDAATGDFAAISVKAGEPVFEEIWRPFLIDFCAHLEKKGWLERTAIAMDERPFALMRPTIDLVRAAAPGLRIALAGKNEPRLKDDIDDWCVFVTPPLDEAIARERTARGLETTFYVCCGPARPNTFTFSPPAESAWLGIYAAARGYTGFLRWAYNSWVDDPLCDTKHVTWPAGDCFVVYPGPRSSIRFERLREGIEEFEKIRIVRALAAAMTDTAVANAAAELDAVLARLTYEGANREPAAVFVSAAEAAIENLSRALSRAMTPRESGGGE